MGELKIDAGTFYNTGTFSSFKNGQITPRANRKLPEAYNKTREFVSLVVATVSLS